jgi:DnaK suppressor protein
VIQSVEIRSESNRERMLRALLNQQRDEILARLTDSRGHDADLQGQSGDEMDVARSLAEAETRCFLLDREESKLRAIDAALARLERGDYGVCANCGEDIPLVRLKVVPFANYCVDCQHERTESMGGRTVQSPRAFRKEWVDTEDSDAKAKEAKAHLDEDDDSSSILMDSPFGPDQDELELHEEPRRKRGRPRKSPVAAAR